MSALEVGQIRRRRKGIRNHWDVKVVGVVGKKVECRDVMQWGVGPLRIFPVSYFLAMYPTVVWSPT